MEINFEVLNYLNMINPCLGTMYKKGKLDYFSKTLTLPDQYFLSRMDLDKLSDEIKNPDFLYGFNMKIRKKYKNSLKINKKLIKIEFSDKFLNKNNNFEIKLYLIARMVILKKLLREYSGSKFDPFKIYEELYKLNPVFEEIMIDSFDTIDDLPKFLIDLPVKYKENYEDKLNTINKKCQKRTKRVEKESFEQKQFDESIKLIKTKKVKNVIKNNEKTNKKPTKISIKEKS